MQTTACSLCLYKQRCLNMLWLNINIYDHKLGNYLVYVCACMHVQCFLCTLIHCACRKCWARKMFFHQYIPPSFFLHVLVLDWYFKKKGVQIILWNSEFLALPQTSCVTLDELLNILRFDRGVEKGGYVKQESIWLCFLKWEISVINLPNKSGTATSNEPLISKSF